MRVAVPLSFPQSPLTQLQFSAGCRCFLARVWPIANRSSEGLKLLLLAYFLCTCTPSSAARFPSEGMLSGWLTSTFKKMSTCCSKAFVCLCSLQQVPILLVSHFHHVHGSVSSPCVLSNTKQWVIFFFIIFYFFFKTVRPLSAAGPWTFNSYALRQEKLAVTESGSLLRPGGGGYMENRAQ